MKILSGIYWNAGTSMHVNQDSCTLQEVVTNKGRVVFAVISDGIGGLYKGELASGYIIEQLVAWFYQTAIPVIGQGKYHTRMKRSLQCSIHGIHRDMKRYARNHHVSFGATMTGILIWRRYYMVFHLGDSRGYLMGRHLKRLTEDHNKGRYELLKSVNSHFWQQPDIRKGCISGNQGILLCTDGFFQTVGEKRLKEALSPEEIRDEEQIELRLSETGKYAMEHGEKDNISAIYIKICRG